MVNVRRGSHTPRTLYMHMAVRLCNAFCNGIYEGARRQV